MSFAASCVPEPHRTTIAELEAEIERLRAFVERIARGGDGGDDFDQFVYLAKELMSR